MGETDQRDDVPRSWHRRYGIVVGVAVVALVVDQLTKIWALERLEHEVVPLFWTLQLNLQHNTGAAFSVGSGTDWGRFLPLAALVVVGIVIWQGRTVATKAGAVAVGLIVGGAIGNLTDRALRTNGGGFFSGAVVDFIDFQWWPVFNVADSCVVIGGILLVLVSLRTPEDAPSEEPPAPRDDDRGAGHDGAGDRSDATA